MYEDLTQTEDITIKSSIDPKALNFETLGINPRLTCCNLDQLLDVAIAVPEEAGADSRF